MTECEAVRFFRKLGALLYFCKIFGIRDLHYENIMASREGPVIIDPECAMISGVVKAKAFGMMELGEFKKAFLYKELKNATFFIIPDGGGEPYIPKWYAPIVNKNVIEGFHLTAVRGVENFLGIQSMYDHIIHMEYKSRIVPLQTEVWQGMMWAYYYNESARAQVLADGVERAWNGLQEFLADASAIEESSVKGQIGNQLERDFFSGDIPVFSIKSFSGERKELWMDDIVLADFTEPILTEVQLREQIEWLQTEEALQAFTKEWTKQQ